MGANPNNQRRGGPSPPSMHTMSKKLPPVPTTTPLYALEDHGEFIMRHIGPRDEQVSRMLAAIGMESLDELVRSSAGATVTVEEVRRSLATMPAPPVGA